MSRREARRNNEQPAPNGDVSKSAPLVRLTKTASRSRQESGGRWGQRFVKERDLKTSTYRHGGFRDADYGAIRVRINKDQEEDPRTTWAAIEEHLPQDLDREYENAQLRDLRLFKACHECMRGVPCDQGQDLAAIRSVLLDAIALRNRGYALLHAPVVQVPGSAYGNTR